MQDLSNLQLFLIALCFAWSGFVRSGLGFGGTVLSLPLMLLVVDDPLLFLPIASIQLLIFSTWITYGHNLIHLVKTGEKRLHSNVDWPYLWHSMKIMIVPKLIGVLGLLTLPDVWLSTIIFGIVIIYSIGYVIGKTLVSNGRWSNIAFLCLGGYASGVSLIGAPLIIAVFGAEVRREQLRDTLFALWFILVVIKLVALMLAGVDLQLVHQIWLLPAAWVGHMLGMQFHLAVERSDPKVFYRVLGGALIVVSVFGLHAAWKDVLA